MRLSQADFGKLIHRSQGVVSKYEQGLVLPDGDTLMHCMNIVKAQIGPSATGTIDQGWEAIHRAMAQLREALEAVEHRDRR
jgi:transcriptional regulator with XRE-family HTH domain